MGHRVALKVAGSAEPLGTRDAPGGCQRRMKWAILGFPDNPNAAQSGGGTLSVSTQGDGMHRKNPSDVERSACSIALSLMGLGPGQQRYGHTCRVSSGRFRQTTQKSGCGCARRTRCRSHTSLLRNDSRERESRIAVEAAGVGNRVIPCSPRLNVRDFQTVGSPETVCLDRMPERQLPETRTGT